MDLLGFIREANALRSVQMDGEKISTLSGKRLSLLLESASRLPRYSKVLSDYPRDEPQKALRSLPLLEKKDVQLSPGSFIAGRTKLTELRTSGSTGMPLGVFADGDSMTHRMALRHFIERESGLGMRDSFAEITYRAFGTVPLLPRLGFFRRKCISVVSPPESIFRELTQFRADAMGLYPSAMQLLARLNKSKGRPLRMKSVFCTAEALEKAAREEIADSFSAGVREFYGATECGYCAWECEEGRMHAVTTSNFVEIVDGKGSPVRSGRGEIAVTPLHNRSMCLLRYRLGDNASWGNPCACGRSFPVLKGLVGKKCGSITLPSGRTISRQNFLRLHLVPGILEYRIVQERKDRFVLEYVPAGADLDGAGKKKARSMIKESCLNEPVAIEFERMDFIPKGRTGKHELVKAL